MFRTLTPLLALACTAEPVPLVADAPQPLHADGAGPDWAPSDIASGLPDRIGARPADYAPPSQEPMGIGSLTAPAGPLVLAHTQVSADISAGLALVTVDQAFTNPYDEPIEATYTLPLPPDAAVRGFRMTCGERVIEGKIADKETARRTYEAARDSGRKAALLEQMRDNLFTQKVAGICPHEEVGVQVEYVQQVARDHGVNRLVFPTTVGERFDAPADLHVPAHTPAPDEGGRSLDILVRIDEGLPIQSLWSDSHAIAVVDEHERGAVIGLDPDDAVPNKDFALAWSAAGEAPAVSAAISPPVGEEPGYIALSIEAGVLVDLPQQRPRELLFVLDASCSMSGTPWQTAADVVELALDEMQPGDRFNVVTFSDEAGSLFDAPQPASEHSVAAAKRWLESGYHGGGTNMTAGITHSLNMPGDPEALRLVLFLTDGYIGRERDIVELVDANLGEARIFALGVGSSVNRLLLENLAEIGRGSAAYQLPGSSRKETVRDFYDRIAHPQMTDITIDFGELDIADTFPSRTPDLWAGQPLRIVGRYRGRGADEITITGLVEGEEYVMRRHVDLALAEENEAVQTLWARRAIHDLVYDLDLTATAREAAITPLALEHHLVSDYTSLVAVETEPSACGAPTGAVEVAHYAPEGTRLDAPAMPTTRRRPRPRPSPRPAPAYVPVAAEPTLEPEPEPSVMPAPRPRPVPRALSVELPSVTGELDADAIREALRKAGLTAPAGTSGWVAFTVTDGVISDVVVTGVDAGAVRAWTAAVRKLSVAGSGTVRVRLSS